MRAAINPQPTLFGDEPLPAHNHTPASIAAAEAVRDLTRTRRQKVLEVVRDSLAGLTRDEIAEILYLPVHAVCPRVAELLRDGSLVKTNQTRPTRAGCSAGVLVDSGRAK